MAQLEKESKQRRRWEKMKTRGHAIELALNVSICVGSYAVVRLMHVVAFKFGWMQSPGATSWKTFSFGQLLASSAASWIGRI
jgi:hypothetical protein